MRTLRGWPRHCVQQGRALSHCCVVFRGMPTPLLGTESGTVSVCVCVWDAASRRQDVWVTGN